MSSITQLPQLFFSIHLFLCFSLEFLEINETWTDHLEILKNLLTQPANIFRDFLAIHSIFLNLRWCEPTIQTSSAWGFFK